MTWDSSQTQFLDCEENNLAELSACSQQDLRAAAKPLLLLLTPSPTTTTHTHTHTHTHTNTHMQTHNSTYKQEQTNVETPTHPGNTHTKLTHTHSNIHTNGRGHTTTNPPHTQHTDTQRRPRPPPHTQARPEAALASQQWPLGPPSLAPAPRCWLPHIMLTENPRQSSDLLSPLPRQTRGACDLLFWMLKNEAETGARFLIILPLHALGCGRIWFLV